MRVGHTPCSTRQKWACGWPMKALWACLQSGEPAVVQPGPAEAGTECLRAHRQCKAGDGRRRVQAGGGSWRARNGGTVFSTALSDHEEVDRDHARQQTSHSTHCTRRKATAFRAAAAAARSAGRMASAGDCRLRRQRVGRHGRVCNLLRGQQASSCSRHHLRRCRGWTARQDPKNSFGSLGQPPFDEEEASSPSLSASSLPGASSPNLNPFPLSQNILSYLQK